MAKPISLPQNTPIQYNRCCLISLIRKPNEVGGVNKGFTDADSLQQAYVFLFHSQGESHTKAGT